MTSLRERVARAVDGARGAVVILSENPIHDTGGGQRSAQLTDELLARGYHVLFVSRGRVTETVDLGLDFDRPRLVQASLTEVSGVEGRSAVAAALGAESAVVVTQVPVPEWTPVLADARSAGAVTVYDCMDPWASELGRGWFDPADEASVARASDVLIASSHALVEHVEALTGRETHLVPNAHDARLFRPNEGWARPVDLPEADRIALFVGALWGGWLDWGLVRAATEACGETRFVFIGDHRREGARLPASCIFLGLKPHTELPPYLAHADVAFLPWRVSDTTHAMSPLTVYDHVAMGLPVVAPPIHTLKGMPGVVPASGRSAFARALRDTGRTSLSERERSEMADFSASSSWVDRVDRIEALVEAWRGRGGAARAGGGSRKRRAIVSVVIPSYNHERFIGEAVDSVRAQTLPAGELVVIDDGSSDASLDVLAAHAFPGMRVIAQTNRGAHATINRAIGLSQGDYIGILNSDDAFDPERLEHAYAVAGETAAALVIGSVRLIDGAGAELPDDHDTARWYARARAEVSAASSLASGVRRENVAVTTSNFFVHRELWRRLGGFRDYRYVHDYDFLLRALQLCPDQVVYAEELCDVRYRVHGDNTITEDLKRALAERAEMLRDVTGTGRRIRAAFTGGAGRRAVRSAVAAAPLLDPGGETVTASATLVDPDREAAAASSPRAGDSGAHGSAAGQGTSVGIVVPSLGRGGLEEVVALLARALPAERVDVSVLCTRSGGSVAERLRDAGVPVTVASNEGGWRVWRERTKPTVLSSHFVDREALVVLGEAGTPIVETVHNTYAWFGPDDWRREAEKARSLAATIDVSETVQRYHAARCPTTAPRHVIPNAVHPARAAAVPKSFARRRLGIAEGDPLFVHVGRVTEQKNLPGLLTAFGDVVEQEPSARLLLVGSDDDRGLLSRLKRAHAALLRSGSVRLVPAVARVGVLLSAADAYVSNSFYEGWSVAASEALWVGRPLVLSETGGAVALVGEDAARGRVVPNPLGDPLAVSRELIAAPPDEPSRQNRGALVEALVEVTGQLEAWQGRAADIRSFARAELAPARMARAYARVFRMVAGRS